MAELPPHIKQGFTNLFESFLATLDRRVGPEEAVTRFRYVAELQARDWFEKSTRQRGCSRPHR